ncbi:MAG TPA: hypothetical protein VIT45_04440 [Allosphingosinicella sp.]
MSEDAHSNGPARGASIVNLGLAALAAGALGFLVFAMPENVFSDMVVQSGLPAWLPAAEPPLGMKARAAVIAAVALLVFAFLFLLLRGVDRLSARPARVHSKPAGAEAELEAPRLRRADAHPDAPAPRPILAGRDLGGFADADEYDYPPDLDDERFADLSAQPLPGFLTASRDEPEDIEEGHFEEAPFEADREPSEVDAPEPHEESGFEAAPEEEEPLILDTPADDRGIEAIGSQLPEAREPLVLDTPADERSIEAIVSQLPEAEQPLDNSITSLMRRLETGLVRREEDGESDPSPEARADEHASAAPSWLAPQPAAQEHESEEVEASGPYDAGEPSSPPPSWLAPQPAAQSPQPIESEQSWEAEEAEAEEQPIAAAPAPEPAPAAPTAANFPPVDEFGEPSWPAPSTGEAHYAPLGAPNRGPAAAPKIQAIAPPPVRSAPAEAEAPAEMSIGRRLRSAIADMDKIASSGG